MPRIRSLKPEHKQHRKIGPLSDRDYRLWVGMITEADDEGRLVADTAQLRMLIFGYHPRVKPEHLEAAILRLHVAGLIQLYEVEGIRYAVFPSWDDHQVISKPQPSKLPKPLHSQNIPGTFPERSGNSPGPSRNVPVGSDLIGSDRKGSDLIGGEGKGGEGKPDSDVTLSLISTSTQPTNGATSEHLVTFAMSDAWRREHRDALKAQGWPAAKADTEAGHLVAAEVVYFREHGHRPAPKA